MGNSIDTDIRLNYITIPITANYHFGKNRNWYLNFGPYVGFLINAEDSEFEVDLKEAFNTTDFGLAYGVGYKFVIADKTKLFVEYEGQSGLTGIGKDSTETVRNGRSALNVRLTFSLGR